MIIFELLILESRKSSNEDIASPVELDVENFDVPPVGNSPVKHSPILPKRDNNHDFHRQPIKLKTPDVRLLFYIHISIHFSSLRLLIDL